MATSGDIVITGIGVVSPIGIGAEAFWSALTGGVSGIRPISLFDAGGLDIPYGGQLADFDPKLYVRPRKSLKVMSRDIQLGFAAADLAMADAGLGAGSLDPRRFGVVFGADMIYTDCDDMEVPFRPALQRGSFDFNTWSEAVQQELHPLWLLKHLPNMTASHVAIAHDAPGPNNSIVLGDVSSLLAVAEAASVIRRGWADVMLTGGTGSRLHPTAMVARGEIGRPHPADDYRRVCRPFDRGRTGMLDGEGAAVFVLESRDHAERRAAHPRPALGDGGPLRAAAPGGTRTGTAVRSVILAVLAAAGLDPRAGRDEIGSVNAHGSGLVDPDRIEASGIAAELGDTPVTALKSFFGNLGAGSGAVELAASVFGLENGLVPPTLNYETPDPLCPVHVVHGRPLAGRRGTALSLNCCSMGQVAAALVAAAD